MNLIDIIIGLIVAVIFVAALRKIIKDRKAGKTCSCGCSKSDCSGCTNKREQS